MARERGTFNFSANLEVKKQGALDSRLVIQTYAELTKAATWSDSDNKVWLYNGMIVSVVADTTGKNGVYMLTNNAKYNEEGSWTRIDAKAADKTVVIDNLESTSSTAALSANQGKVLNDKFTAHANNADIHFTAEERTKLTGIEAGAQVNKVTSVAGKEGAVTLVKADVGLDKVDNTADTDKPVSTKQAAAIKVVQDDLNTFKATKGSNNGIASLDENGKVPAAQLPSYVDDVVEADTKDELPDTGETGKIYVTKDDNLTYRWSGTDYVEISQSLALGETDSTAYAGSKGKKLADDVAAHIANHENPHGVTAEQLGINLSELATVASVNAELAKKVDKIDNKSLVADSEITKLTALPNKADLDSAIADAKKAGTDAATDAANAEAHLSAVSGQTTGAYVANATSNYIKTATSLNDADIKLDAKIKENADAIAALGGSGSGSVQDQITSAVNAAKEELTGKINEEKGARETADSGLSDRITTNTNSIGTINTTIGSSSDASTKDTIYGAIKKESEARVAGDNAINDKIGSKTSATIEATNVWGAIEELESEASAANTAATELTNRVSAVEKSASDNKQSITDLDTAVSAVKNKTVGTTITDNGSDTVLSTTKAVVDYVKASTNGVANSMTYTAKTGDATKMELKLIAVDGSTLSTIEMDKENFLNSFVKREATAEDHTADPTIAVGDPILVVTTVNGQTFRVSLKSLVDVYNGETTNSIITTVDGYKISSNLKLDTTTQNSNAVKLSVGSNGLSADVSLDSTKNGSKGVVLSKSGNGISAEMKIDAATNTANGTVVNVGANGISVGITWVEI